MDQVCVRQENKYELESPYLLELEGEGVNPVDIQMEKDCRVEYMSLESRRKIWPRVIELK